MPESSDKGHRQTNPSIRSLAGRLIVSCQAPDGDVFRDSGSMARFARVAVAGGAGAIRANGPEDVRAIRQAVAVPVIGLQKRMQPDGKPLITPSFADARSLVEAGAAIVAVDCTVRGQLTGALERIRRIRTELSLPVWADIATMDEAVSAEQAGADLVAGTMRGYTKETESVRGFDCRFIADLCQCVRVPVIAEGRIASPRDAANAIRAGAYAVTVGTAITRPELITANFVSAMEAEYLSSGTAGQILGIDLGGTFTKAAIVSPKGGMSLEFVVPTPARTGGDLLRHLKNVAYRGLEAAKRAELPVGAIGIATAGWVDPHTGRIVYATGNLPGWTGTRVAEEVGAATGLPVAVENDANALAIAERHFGAGRGVDDFVCLTLGTGIGGGCYSGGRLLRGAHFFANALGHIPIRSDGLPCTCGLKGCLEVYANADALVRYAGGSFSTAEAVIAAANSSDAAALAALQTYAGYLAPGIVSIVHLLDPEIVILSGGIAQQNPLLLTFLNRHLEGVFIAAEHRAVSIGSSSLGYYGGVLGAASLVLESH